MKHLSKKLIAFITLLIVGGLLGFLIFTFKDAQDTGLTDTGLTDTALRPAELTAEGEPSTFQYDWREEVIIIPASYTSDGQITFELRVTPFPVHKTFILFDDIKISVE